MSDPTSWAEIVTVLGTFVGTMGGGSLIVSRSLNSTRTQLGDKIDRVEKQITTVKKEMKEHIDEKIGIVRDEVKTVEADLKCKVSRSVCDALTSGCRKSLEVRQSKSEEDRKDLWANIDGHGHSGLPKDSKVTRKG